MLETNQLVRIRRFMDVMFENIGDKIKKISTILFILIIIGGTCLLLASLITYAENS